MTKRINRLIKERDFQQQIIEAAHLLDWKVYHTYDSRRCQPGYPDLTMVKPPRVIFAEIKQEGKYPTPIQREWQEALRRCPGVEVYVWKPSQWEDAVKILSNQNRGADLDESSIC